MYGVRVSSRTVLRTIRSTPRPRSYCIFSTPIFQNPMAENGSCGLSKPKVGKWRFFVPAVSALVKSRISEKRHPERKAGGAFQEDSTLSLREIHTPLVSLNMLSLSQFHFSPLSLQLSSIIANYPSHVEGKDPSYQSDKWRPRFSLLGRG